MIVRFRTTSELGLIPNGVPSAPNILAWLDGHIVDCNVRLKTAEMNGTTDSETEGARATWKWIKAELFGEVYNT